MYNIEQFSNSKLIKKTYAEDYISMRILVDSLYESIPKSDIYVTDTTNNILVVEYLRDIENRKNT